MAKSNKKIERANERESPRANSECMCSVIKKYMIQTQHSLTHTHTHRGVYMIPNDVFFAHTRFHGIELFFVCPWRCTSYSIVGFVFQLQSVCVLFLVVLFVCLFNHSFSVVLDMGFFPTRACFRAHSFSVWLENFLSENVHAKCV